jgi:hypothetical protein
VAIRALQTEEATDAAIIERSLRETEAFAAIFDRYYALIHGYAARRLGGSLADDVAAETFLLAFDGRAKYDLARQDARPRRRTVAGWPRPWPSSPPETGTCSCSSPGPSSPPSGRERPSASPPVRPARGCTGPVGGSARPWIPPT